MNNAYCDYCGRQFKSNLSLRMHWVTSKYHRKGSVFYHVTPKQEIKKEKIGINSDQFRKITQFLSNSI